jgi:hypothetical protein
MKRGQFLYILAAGLAAPALALETSYDADRILKEIQGREFKSCIVKFRTIFADKEFEVEYVIYKSSKFSNTQLEIIKEDLADIENSKGFIKWISASYNKKVNPNFTGAYLSVLNNPNPFNRFFTFIHLVGRAGSFRSIPMGDIIYYFNKNLI